MTNSTTGPHTGKRSALRLAAAGLVTLFLGLVAAIFWIVAQAQYTNDYCHTRAPQPEATPPESASGRPAYFGDPVTIVCEYDKYPTIEIFEPGPFLGALFLAAVVVGIGVGLFRWAWRPKSPKRRGSPTEEPSTELT